MGLEKATYWAGPP